MRYLFTFRFDVLRGVSFEKRIADVLDEFTVILHWSNQGWTIFSYCWMLKTVDLWFLPEEKRSVLSTKRANLNVGAKTYR